MTETVDLAIFEKADADDIERYISELPREQVVAFLHFTTTLRKALGIGEKFLNSRIEEASSGPNPILSAGEVWTSSDGDEFMWTGDRRRECADGEGLRLALAPIVTASANVLVARAFRDAFKTETKTYMTELDKIARFAPEAKGTIEDFVNWHESAKKLRPLDEEGK